eukprot:m.113898 g.113898  ORF g.113898 m.113898 type:complete len:338 (+) comp17108_c0_seq2:295-1308(+)
MMSEEFPSVEARLQGLQKSGEEWKNKPRHSKIANADTDVASKLEAISLSVPISERLNAMEKDGEKWKMRKRHSQMENVIEADGSVVSPDGDEADEPQTFRRTGAGHVIRATRRVGLAHGSRSASSGANSADDVDIESMLRSKAKLSDAPNNTAVEPGNPPSETDPVLYADVEFNSDRPAARDADESVIYTQVRSANASKAVPNESSGNSDDSTEDEEAEAALLYDNSDYTGTAGFQKKQRGMRRKTRQGKAPVVSAAAEAERENHAYSHATAKEATGAVSADRDTATRDAGTEEDTDESDLDPEDEEKMLYDNEEYTGRHPHLQKRKNVKRKPKTQA